MWILDSSLIPGGLVRKLMVNVISFTRFPAAAVVVWLVAGGRWGWAVLILLVGLASDLLDGRLARRWQAVTRFGYHLDGQSDRALLLAPIVGMAVAGDLPWWGAIALAIGLHIADLVSDSFEIMRMFWWPLCYAVILYGFWQSELVSRLASG